MAVRRESFSFKQLATPLGVGRRRALLVIVEIDINIAATPIPTADMLGPFGELGRFVTSAVASARTMAANVDKICSPLPRRWRIVMIGDAERDVLGG
ncbi:hypothetical protein BLN97_43470 [Bradyrhizobium elkanii]|nr:hypothetical protein BLN97_43470 [Bradyrhizobium elkanii]GEC55150.1 hypothetical protein BEL01nite_41930 [Bradyrhizobium elkanii]